ncbi:MAG: HD domain-containing protein [Actinobacteria bacterium]|nr:HD domain-containing protein [Actinomycetota bacterium]
MENSGTRSGEGRTRSGEGGERGLLAAAIAGCAASLAVILYLTLAKDQPVLWFSVVILGILAVLCESMGEEMSTAGRSTYGIIALFAAMAALNTPSAMIVALCGAGNLRLWRERESAGKMLFNAAVYSLGIWMASALYHALNGSSQLFTFSQGLRSVLPALAAAALFWAFNTSAIAAALALLRGVSPLGFLRVDALRLFPNQLIYGLVGLGVGIIYAQNAFHLVQGATGEPVLDALGRPLVEGSVSAYLRGLFAVLSLVVLLGISWYFSGRNIELLESYDRSVETLVTYLERREPYLDGHASRVAQYATLIAERMRLSLFEVRRLRHAALLHDLGRPAIPLGILLQASPLSEEEFDRIKAHPLEGSSRLEEVAYLADMAEAVRHHHEYYDGGGYVDHLARETIPLSARIIAVADAYDAMTHERPHRGAKGHERAVAELRQNSGLQFDPEVVEHFIAALEGRGGERGPVAVEAEGAEPGVAPEASEAPREKQRRAVGRRARKREEMLRARREARERLEREAMRELEETEEGGESREGIEGSGPPASGAEAGEEVEGT